MFLIYNISLKMYTLLVTVLHKNVVYFTWFTEVAAVKLPLNCMRDIYPVYQVGRYPV